MKVHHQYVRDVEFLEMVRGRLQSLSSVVAAGGGAISRLLRLPNRLPGRSPSTGAAGLNLLPMCQFSSVSARPEGGGASRDGGPRRLNPPSESCDDMVEVRAGAREDRQSEAPSDTDGGGGSRAGPSKRRLEPSREEGRSGRGPSLLQFPANFSSSNPPPPPKPERSFSIGAFKQRESLDRKGGLTRFGDADSNTTSSK